MVLEPEEEGVVKWVTGGESGEMVSEEVAVGRSGESAPLVVGVVIATGGSRTALIYPVLLAGANHG